MHGSLREDQSHGEKKKRFQCVSADISAHLSLRVGHQLSGGPLQVGQGVSKHLRTSDGAHGCGCGHLAGQRVQLLRDKNTKPPRQTTS